VRTFRHIALRKEHEVYVQDLDTGTSTRVVTVANRWRIHSRRDEIANWHLFVKHTKWSRDGKQVLYASDAFGTAQLCAINL